MRKIFTRRGKCTLYLCDDYKEFNRFLTDIENYEDVEFGLSNIPINWFENIKWIELGDDFHPTRVGKLYPYRRLIEVYHGTVFEDFFNKYLKMVKASNSSATEKPVKPCP